MTLEPIAPGLHESLVTTELQNRLALVSGLDVATGQIDPADLPQVLAQHVYAAAHRAFAGCSADDAVDLANQLIETLQATGTEVSAPASQLLRA